LAGDGGPALLARFSLPTRVAPDPDGNLFIADADGHRVRRIANSVPVAAAQSAVSGTGVVSLNGSTSVDADSDPLQYRWTNEADAVVATTASVSLTPPAGHRAYTLTVKDGRGGTSSAVTNVDVNHVVEVTAPGPDKNVFPIGSTQQIAWRHNLGDGGRYGSSSAATEDARGATSRRPSPPGPSPGRSHGSSPDPRRQRP
jgi:hypothetical protein